MKVMVTIAAIVIAIVAIITGIGVGQVSEGIVGFLAFVIVLLVGFLLIGTTGMIAEGVGHLETIAYEMKANRQQSITSGNTYSQSTGGNGESSSQGGSVVVSNGRAKSILEIAQGNRKQSQPRLAANDGGWLCPKCGEKNEKGNTYCKYCGTHK